LEADGRSQVGRNCVASLASLFVCRSNALRPRALRPQLKRDPLGGAMSQRQFASVLFAVLGVFIALNWLPQIVVAIGLFAQPTETSAGHQANSAYAITLLIGTLIAVLLAITLVVMRERLAARLFPA